MISGKTGMYTVREAARQLRVNDTTIRRWIKRGAMNAIALPHKGIRRIYRIPQATLDALPGLHQEG